MSKKSQQRSNSDQFSSFGFIMAAIGSAVGIGNMWKFPYLTGSNGGGAFLFVFIICLVLVGIPILLAELSLGRAGRGDAMSCFQVLALKQRKLWASFGLLSIIAAFMIYSFYIVVTGWTFNYAVESFSGALYQKPDFAAYFNEFSGGGWPLFYMIVTVVIAAVVLMKGVSKGIELFNKILIPVLGVLLVVLMVVSFTLPGAKQGVEFFLKPDFSELSIQSTLVALGQAFFSLSLGMGAMVTYGAYVEKDQSLGRATLAVSVGNIIYAVIAGLIIFPMTFSYGLEPAAGPGLIFVALPTAFANMPFGHMLGGFFFLLIAFAALTSCVSVLEVIIAFVIKHLGWTRRRAVTVLSCLSAVIAVPISLSVGGPIAEWKLFGFNLFDLFDYIASNIFLPIAGLGVTLFVGYISKTAAKEANLQPGMSKVWLTLLRYVVPVFVILIFLYSTGLIA